MNIINLAANLPFDPFSWLAVLTFLFGYTWSLVQDNITPAVASQMNDVQDDKLDRDGTIPYIGTAQWDKGTDIASAAILVPPKNGNSFDVTGNATVTSIAAAQSQAGTVIKLHFDSILIIVHDNDDIVTPDGKNIYTMAGMELEFTEYAAGKWRCTGYLRGVPVLTNLFKNSGFSLWSQSDANKGLCQITYDAGAKGAGSAPSVGDAVVGGTSGAVGVVISYTTATGDWDTGDATGVLTLGACTGSWIDNEVLTFAGVETAAVNGEAIGIANDPCNNDGTGDWTDPDAILSDNVGEYLVTTDANNEKAYLTGLTFTEGKIYKVEAALKDGTATPTDVQLVSLDGAVVEYSSKPINTTAAFVTYSCTFEATADTDGVGIITPTSLGGSNIEMKWFICYEITPCCTGANNLAFDEWSKDTTLDIYRQHNDGGTLTKDGSFYSVRCVPTSATSDWLTWDYLRRAEVPFYQQFARQPFTVGIWAKTSAADHFRWRVYDGGAYNTGAYHSGGGDWEWLEIKLDGNANPDEIVVAMQFSLAGNTDGSTIVYLSQPMNVFGSHVGEGNYQCSPNERLYTKAQMLFNSLDNVSNFSTQAFADLNVEAETDARVPKGCRALEIYLGPRDSGSAGSTTLASFRPDAVKGVVWACTLTGLANNSWNYRRGTIECGIKGDIDYSIAASGGSTFDFAEVRVVGVQLN